MAHLDAVIKVDEEMLQRLIKQSAEPLFAVADAADELLDRLFLEQDLWTDPRYQHVRDAAVEVDKALARLERETDYVRQDNRAE